MIDVKQKGVDKRVKLLASEYQKKARNVDKDFVGTLEGEVGPVERRLAEYGELLCLVVGAWGEGSEDLHDLIHTMAKCRVNALGLARGRPGSEAELGMVLGQVRRSLSVASVRARSACLLTRLSLLGEGSKKAMSRRQFQGWEEEKMRKEKQANWIGRIRRHGITHGGAFFLT